MCVCMWLAWPCDTMLSMYHHWCVINPEHAWWLEGEGGGGGSGRGRSDNCDGSSSLKILRAAHGCCYCYLFILIKHSNARYSWSCIQTRKPILWTACNNSARRLRATVPPDTGNSPRKGEGAQKSSRFQSVDSLSNIDGRKKRNLTEQMCPCQESFAVQARSKILCPTNLQVG